MQVLRIILIGALACTSFGCSYLGSNKDNTESTGEPAAVYDEAPAGEVTAQGNNAGILIRPGESLLSVGNRIVFNRNLTRVVFDLDGETMPPDMARAKRSINLASDELFANVAEQFEKYLPGIKLMLALDREGQALVITNRKYPSWQSQEVFDVRPGTLLGNSMVLATTLGWAIDEQTGWKADDFQIQTTYPIVVSADDIRAAFSRLFEKYPNQARINPNTGNIVVVPRLQPKS